MLERFPVDKADFDGPVLITGAGGCIGSWASALLVRAGVPVVVYDLTDDKRRPRLLMTDDRARQGHLGQGRHRRYRRGREGRGGPPRARDHPPGRAPGAVLQGRPGPRRAGQRGRHGQRPGSRKAPGPEAGRLRQLDRGLELLPGRPLARHPLRRLQALQRDDGQRLLPGLGRPQRRHPPGRGLRRRARPGPDLQDHDRDPRRRREQALHHPLHRRGLRPARRRSRLGLHQSRLQGAQRSPRLRPQRPPHLGRRNGSRSCATSPPTPNSR